MTAHRTTVAALAAVAGLLTTVAAPAAERTAVHTETASVVVSYGDLNLESERGVKQLQRRLVAAARQVCGDPNARDLRLAARSRACVDAALDRAVVEVGNARLAQLNAGRARALRG